jgi:hypothetical protein
VKLRDHSTTGPDERQSVETDRVEYIRKMPQNFAINPDYVLRRYEHFSSFIAQRLDVNCDCAGIVFVRVVWRLMSVVCRPSPF